MEYDYKDGKKRIEDILDGDLEIIESSKLPSGDNFTFDNAYHSWITAIFIDIRNSTTLMSKPDQEYVSKVVRSFTSEAIEILRGDTRERELGIRGDCVYAVYTTPQKSDINEVFDKTVWLNTYIDMLNSILSKKGYERIRAGIGIATGQDHVVKAGRKNVGINSIVWMGDAVSKAAKLSDYGDGTVPDRIVLSKCTYINIIDHYRDTYPGKGEGWFHSDSRLPYKAKRCNIIKTTMNKWINDGMPG